MNKSVGIIVGIVVLPIGFFLKEIMTFIIRNLSLTIICLTVFLVTFVVVKNFAKVKSVWEQLKLRFNQLIQPAESDVEEEKESEKKEEKKETKKKESAWQNNWQYNKEKYKFIGIACLCLGLFFFVFNFMTNEKFTCFILNYLILIVIGLIVLLMTLEAVLRRYDKEKFAWERYKIDKKDFDNLYKPSKESKSPVKYEFELLVEPLVSGKQAFTIELLWGFGILTIVILLTVIKGCVGLEIGGFLLLIYFVAMQRYHDKTELAWKIYEAQYQIVDEQGHKIVDTRVKVVEPIRPILTIPQALISELMGGSLLLGLVVATGVIGHFRGFHAAANFAVLLIVLGLVYPLFSPDEKKKDKKSEKKDDKRSAKKELQKAL